MKINNFNFPEDLYYDEKHGWARVEGKKIVCGLTELGQAVAKEIIFVGLQKIGLVVQQGKTFASLESGKWVGRVPAMASGKVSSVNLELETSPELINNSPFEDGWLVEIEMSDPAELSNLMRADSQSFEDFIKSEFQKHSKILGGSG